MQKFDLSPMLLLIGMLFFSCSSTSSAQDENAYIRIVDLVVDATHLESFKTALKEDIEAAVQTEPDVLMLYAVFDQEHPTYITVFEIYAHQEAHQAHQQTPHFMKYKKATQGMVTSVVRREVTPIVLEAKQH